MADMITTSVSWGGKETLEYFLKPLYVGKDPRTLGFRVLTNIKSGQKLNYFSTFNKVTRAWVQGFVSANESTLTQRTITVAPLKAEVSQNARQFEDTVFEQALASGVDTNEVQGIIEQIMLSVFSQATMSDFNRLAWLADTDKETLVSSTYGNYSGTADTDYNMFDGFWKLIFDNAATSPSTSQIKRLSLNSTTYLASAAVAQVQTLTVSLSSGGSEGDVGTITVNGVAYTITYTTNVATTITTFVAANLAAFAARGITLSGTSTTILMTSAIAGQPFTKPVYAASTGSGLAISVADTTPNTAPGNLTEDKGIVILRAMYDAQPKNLKVTPNDQKAFYVSPDIEADYRMYLEDLSTEQANTMLIDGKPYLTFRGIPVVSVETWEQYEDDWPHVNSSTNPAYHTKAILTIPGNLIVGIDGTADDMNIQYWYNIDEQESRMRVEYNLGTQYVHNDLIVVAY